MTNPEMPRHVEVKDGDHTIAAAEVTTAQGAEGTARTSLYPPSGHAAPGSRASLVDAVMDTPEVQASSRLEATVPLGDGEDLFPGRSRGRALAELAVDVGDRSQERRFGVRLRKGARER